MAVQAFRPQTGQAMFSGQRGNLPPEQGIDRLWGICGGFLNLAAVSLRIEARFAGQRADSNGGCDDADADS